MRSLGAGWLVIWNALQEISQNFPFVNEKHV